MTAATAPQAPGPRPRTVIHLITTLTQGGAERVLSEVVPRPDEAGLDGAPERHVVVSLAAGGMFADVLRERGVEVRDLGMRPGRDLVRGARRLRRTVAELGPDVVIAWMYHACLLATITAGVRDPIGARPRPRVVWFLQASLADVGVLSWHARIVIRLLALLSPRQPFVAVNSHAGIADHRTAGFRPQAWRLVPNGCDTSRFRPDPLVRAAMRDDLGLSVDDVVVAYVGRNHAEKGFDRLVAATAHLDDPRVRVIAVGSGTEAAPTPIIGLGSRDAVEQILAASDVFVLPSRTEGIPNALLEAMACGLPVVATDVGDCRAIVGDAGTVVPADADPGRLAAAVMDLVRAGRPERTRLGLLARERITAEYDLPGARAVYRALWEPTASADGGPDVDA